MNAQQMKKSLILAIFHHLSAIRLASQAFVAAFIDLSKEIMSENLKKFLYLIKSIYVLIIRAEKRKHFYCFHRCYL